jgi:hypothetical protein
VYKSLTKGVTYIQGRLYKLDALDVVKIHYEGNKHSPPRVKTLHPPTQEVLKELFEMGHEGIIIVKE